MRLSENVIYKAKPDIFLLKTKEGAYIRNSETSVTIKGKGIYTWLEKLIPLFNGQNKLDEIASLLSDEQKSMFYKVVEILLNNDLLKRVQDYKTNSFSQIIIEEHRSQIEFIEYYSDNAIERFQKLYYSKVLIIGSGLILNSTTFSLLNSGIKKIDIILTKKNSINIKRLMQLQNEAKKRAISVLRIYQKTGNTIALKTIQTKKYEYVIYAEDSPQINFLSQLEKYAMEQQFKMFILFFLEQLGIVCPLLIPGKSTGWSSLWHSIQLEPISKDEIMFNPAITTASILANICAFELFKLSTGCLQSELINKVYLLDLKTLEGNFHNVFPHPIHSSNYLNSIEISKDKLSDPINFSINYLLDKQVGIFLEFHNEDLKQLPLSHYQVKVVDMLAKGPGEHLPKISIFHISHDQIRREALLKGIELYISRPAYEEDVEINKVSLINFFSKISLDEIKYYDITSQTNSKVDALELQTIFKDKKFAFGTGFSLEKAIIKAFKNLFLSEIHNMTINKKISYRPVDVQNNNVLKEYYNFFNIYGVHPSIYITNIISMNACLIRLDENVWYGVGETLLESIQNAIINCLSYLQDKEHGSRPKHIRHALFFDNSLECVAQRLEQQQDASKTLTDLSDQFKILAKKVLFIKLDEHFIFNKLGITSGIIITS